MTRLCDVRVQVAGTLVAYAGKPVTLEHDDAFLIESITVPSWDYEDGEHLLPEPGELFKLVVNGEEQFAWPLELMVLAYKRYVTSQLPDVFNDVHACLKEVTESLLQRLPDGVDPQSYVELSAAGQLMKSFSTAAAEYIATPGIVLSRPIMVPPRASVVVRSTGDAPVMAYLCGMRTVRRL